MPSHWLTDQECGELVGIPLPAGLLISMAELLSEMQRAWATQRR